MFRNFLKSRTLRKTASWSLLAFSVTTIVAYVATGSLAQGGTIGLFARGIKIPAYWLHERYWASVKALVDPALLVSSPEWPNAEEPEPEPEPPPYASGYRTWQRELATFDEWSDRALATDSTLARAS